METFILIDEVVILAGGKGTRLKKIFPKKQKVIVDVKGRPFLFYTLDKIVAQNFKKVILSVGYRYSEVLDAVMDEYSSKIKIEFSIEEMPLGTGGALKKAIDHINGTNFIAINGDSYNDINLNELSTFHELNNNQITILLKKMKKVSRYGSLKIDCFGNIESFEEKKNSGTNMLINAGIYVFEVEVFRKHSSKIFSLEYDLLPKYIGNRFKGLVSDKTFIDIGVPRDYKLAHLINLGESVS